jgi:hypothetical protein
MYNKVKCASILNQGIYFATKSLNDSNTKYESSALTVMLSLPTIDSEGMLTGNVSFNLTHISHLVKYLR